MGLNRIRLNSPESSDNEVNVPHTQATSDDQVLDTNKGTNNTATEDMQEPSNVDLFDEEVELSSVSLIAHLSSCVHLSSPDM